MPNASTNAKRPKTSTEKEKPTKRMKSNPGVSEDPAYNAETTTLKVEDEPVSETAAAASSPQQPESGRPPAPEPLQQRMSNPELEAPAQSPGPSLDSSAETPIVIGAYTFPSPFECHSCDAFKSRCQKEVTDHLATAEHHRAHEAFVTAQRAQGELTPEEIHFLDAMDLYKAPPPLSLTSRLMARVTMTPLRASPDALADDSKATTPSRPKPQTDGAPAPSATSTARNLRSSSSSTPRKAYGNGPAGDSELAQKLQEMEMNGQSSPARAAPAPAERAPDARARASESTQVRPLAGQTRGPHGPSIPWHDYICNVTLNTEEEAAAHFRKESHRLAVRAFVAKHKTELETHDPAALQTLANTILPDRSELTFAEKLAAAERADTGPRPPPRSAGQPMDRPVDPQPPFRPSSTSGKADSLPDPDSEDFGRRLTSLGKDRATVAHIFQIGLQETLRWEGRYKDMPIPAECTICNKTLPHEWQAEAHCNSKEHRDRCARQGEDIIAKARRAAETKARSTLTSTASLPLPRIPRVSTSNHNGGSRIKAAPPLVDFPCAGARCRGRVSVPAGDPKAEGQCNTCRFSQVVPTNRNL